MRTEKSPLRMACSASSSSCLESGSGPPLISRLGTRRPDREAVPESRSLISFPPGSRNPSEYIELEIELEGQLNSKSGAAGWDLKESEHALLSPTATTLSQAGGSMEGLECFVSSRTLDPHGGRMVAANRSRARSLAEED